MTHFTTNENGEQTFTHEGWEVQIWDSQWVQRIRVTSPDSDDIHDVGAGPDGIWVNGSTRTAWHDGPSAFIIPWPVIEAIVEARQIVSG